MDQWLHSSVQTKSVRSPLLPVPVEYKSDLTRRGVWDRRTGWFYASGYAICDWWADYSAGQRRAYARRQAAAANGIRVVGGPRIGAFGPLGGRRVN